MPEASAAAVTPLARPDPPAETLLNITIINARGMIILETIWLSDRRRGRRRSDFEDVKDQAGLMRRLGELAPLLFAPQPEEMDLEQRQRRSKERARHPG